MWRLSSRVHLLNHFSQHNKQCYVKRDDELSCGISGTKLRKYSSIAPYLIKNKIKHLVIIAGPQSNNLLAALQVARELQCQVTAFLLRPKRSEVVGNFKLSSLFLEDNEIIWIEREYWHDVNYKARIYVENLHNKAFLLYEGASVPEALEGAMTLASDIIKNEQELNTRFSHIFIDAGTGFSAAALVHGLALNNHAALVHILLLADTVESFYLNLQQWLGYTPKNFVCWYPSTARSFGSVNRAIKKEIQRLARDEGILAEPIYSAKLFYEVRKKVERDQLEEPVLVIHSGGILTLPSFTLI